MTRAHFPEATAPSHEDLEKSEEEKILETKMGVKYILVPGLGGSKLYCHCNSRKGKLYPSSIPFWDLVSPNKHAMSCVNIQTKPLIRYWGKSIYAKLIGNIQTLGNAECVIYSYNFYHYDLIETAWKLMDFILLHAKDENVMLIPIGHSMGAFLLRLVLEYLVHDIAPDNVRNAFLNLQFPFVYLCGGPFYGSMLPETYGMERLFGDLYCKEWKIENKWETTSNLQKSIGSISFPPKLISLQSVTKMVKKHPTTMQLLLPSYMVLNNSQCDEKTRSIHRRLSEMAVCNSIGRYIFFYSIKEYSYVEQEQGQHQQRSMILTMLLDGRIRRVFQRRGKLHIHKCLIHDGQIVTPTVDELKNCRLLLGNKSHPFLMNDEFLLRHLRHDFSTL